MDRDQNKKAITIKDVASEAGVCFQTVSKVLNNKADWVSAKTRQRVLDAVEMLGYEPNHTASTLRSGKTMTIGIISGAFLEHMGNPDLARYYAGIGQRTQQAGYYMTFMPQCCKLGDQKFIPRLKKVIKGRVVDGLIMLVFPHLRDTFHDETLKIFQDGDLPLVVLQLNSDSYDCPTVGFDIELAGYKSTKHLLDTGHSDIACVSRSSPYGSEYYRGYQRAMNEGGQKIHKAIYSQGNHSVQSGAELAKIELAKNRLHRAYIICRDCLANGFVHQMQLAGKKIPNDIAVVGCDSLVDPNVNIATLTTIDRKFEAHGYMAADMLFQQLQNPDSFTQARKIIEPELLIRTTA